MHQPHGTPSCGLRPTQGPVTSRRTVAVLLVAGLKADADSMNGGDGGNFGLLPDATRTSGVTGWRSVLVGVVHCPALQRNGEDFVKTTGSHFGIRR